MKLQFERLYPLIFAVIAGVLWHQFGLKFPATDTVLSSTLTVAGIVVGFLATSKAILMSMSSPIIDDLKQSGYIHVCGINVVGFFIDTSNSWYGLIWVAIAIGALSGFVRVTHIMLKIFKHG